MIARRHFLASGGGAGGAAPTGQAASSHAMVPSLAGSVATARWRILGIAPASEKLPELGQDYRRGVELGLATAGAGQPAGVEITWLAAGPSPGAPAKAVGEALRTSRFDAVMGWMPPLLARKVAALAAPQGIPLWISDSGADAPPVSASVSAQPLQVRHSLELCAVASALADKVHAQCGPRAFLALGWHESGYDFMEAFQQRWRALGGQLAGRHIAGTPGQAHEFEGLKASVLSHKADVVVALYSGPQARRFAQWWQAQPALQAMDVAGFPWLPENGSGLRAWTAGSWPAAQSADAAWVDRFEAARLSWTPAALLGAEAGASLGAALAAATADATAQSIWADLAARPLHGPRGVRHWTPGGLDSGGPLWAVSALGIQTGQSRRGPTLLAHASAQGGWSTGYLLT